MRIIPRTLLRHLLCDSFNRVILLAMLVSLFFVTFALLSNVEYCDWIVQSFLDDVFSGNGVRSDRWWHI